MAVLDRIEVTVIDVALEIPVVAERVLPMPALPDAALALGLAARRNRLRIRKAARNADRSSAMSSVSSRCRRSSRLTVKT